MRRLLILPLLLGVSLPVLADLGDAEVSVEEVVNTEQKSNQLLLNPSNTVYEGFCGEVSKEDKTECLIQFKNGLLTVNEGKGLELKKIKDIKYEIIGNWGFMGTQYWWYQYTFIYESDKERTEADNNSLWPLKMPWDSTKELKAAKITLQHGTRGGYRAAMNFQDDIETWIGGSLWIKCTGAVPLGGATKRCDDRTNSYDPAARARAISGALAPLNNALQQRNNYIFTPTSPNNYGSNSPASQDYQNHLKQNQQFNQQQYQRHTDSMQDFRIRQLESGY
ncbi:hypothetical protein [Prochlorococcus marinus]|uniref:hypothetical protein n=1 Tax=Prochlorococcus marinus TaxID=1219 RepID=UPI0022B5E2D8|nr:hypothetical protein [Prochlorococcus marinus]